MTIAPMAKLEAMTRRFRLSRPVFSSLRLRRGVKPVVPMTRLTFLLAARRMAGIEALATEKSTITSGFWLARILSRSDESGTATEAVRQLETVAGNFDIDSTDEFASPGPGKRR